MKRCAFRCLGRFDKATLPWIRMGFSRSLLLSLPLLLSSCVHRYREQVDGSLQAWIGQSPDRLVESWGAPRSTYQMDDGRKVLTFEDTSFISRTVSPYYFYPRPEVYSYSDSCKINFYTDASGKALQSFSYAGSLAVCRDLIESSKAMQRSPAAGAVPAVGEPSSGK